MRNRTTIRLTENDLNNLVAEAATRLINELDKKTYAMAAKKALDRGVRREEGGKASKAVVRKIVNRLAKNQEFLDKPDIDKLNIIQDQLEEYYYNLAHKFGLKASDNGMPSATGIEKMAKSILANYFYDKGEGKWKANDMADIGVDYSHFYNDPLS